MYAGAHVKPKKHTDKKPYIMFISILLAAAVAVGGTAAFLSTDADPLTNTFTVPGGPKPTVEETFNGRVKSNVSVSVESDIKAYVRAKVIINLLDQSGNVLGTPASGDYSISYNETDWYHDTVTDTWYYKGIVDGDGETAVLINSAASDKPLSVDIIAQTVQAESASAVSDAWGMSYANGTWSAASAN